jgi:hypothetical protein
LERCATPFHLLHGAVIGQDLAGSGIHVYVPDGATGRAGKGGYESIKAPDELALGLGQERLVSHYHVAHPLDQPAIRRATGCVFIYCRSDVLTEEIIGEIGHFFDGQWGQHA